MGDIDEFIGRTGNEIAVIGLSGRFPGAGSIGEFWDNLINGVESVTFFSNEELEEADIDPGSLMKPGYVKARAVLDRIDYFDSSFFGYTPGDVEIMDPQVRILHECVWEALEDAGYIPGSYRGFIGLYAGASTAFAWQALTMLTDTTGMVDYFSAMQLRDKDFMTTRISYKLDLKGPSFTLSTACSTSLVAIVLGCRGLLSGDCDIALAGGVTVTIPQEQGYLYREGMIASPDGHCRAFDSKARGIVFGNGAGIAVLKLLEDAVEHGDNIYAVIKGSAMNNDGTRKAGYSAPSIDGQAEAIKAALEMAEVEPGTVRYVETHGTGTVLGDPVEIEALKMAFNTPGKGFCALGSVKTNMGHLDSAAGIAGFIKTVLILKHRQIPPTIHFETPNPRIDFENSPFYVNSRLQSLETGSYPFRAGVSSFGIGGTNAHVMLEEWTGYREQEPNGRERQLILLSAKTETALEKMAEKLVGHLEKNPGINLADAAYTLQVGRQTFPHRQMFTASSIDEAVRVLSSPQSPDLHRAFYEEKAGKNPVVIFMFPGQGAQYLNMGLDLYRSEAIFREEIDRCFEILRPLLEDDLFEIIFNRSDRSNRSYENKIDQTQFAQPLIFIVEYALAKLLIKWGIEPGAMIGHSIGEYVAAHLAGVLTLRDALVLVVMRGKLMQQMASGAMLSVSLPEDRLIPLLSRELSLAAVNSSSLCTVSGSHDAVKAFEMELTGKGIQCRILHTSHAFHSTLMEPMLAEFEKTIRRIVLNKPKLPYISNLTGHWITDEQVTDPHYWTAHVRETVRFSGGLEELLKEEDSIFLEVGPGKALSTFVKNHEHRKNRHRVLNLLKHPSEEISDIVHLLNQVGRLWLWGKTVDWTEFYDNEKRRRVSMPVYPFEGRFYPVKGDPFVMAAKMAVNEGPPRRKSNMADWFYIPLWEQSILPLREPSESGGQSNWLIFTDENTSVNRLVEGLKNSVPDVIFTIVNAGPSFVRIHEHCYTIHPSRLEDYQMLFEELRNSGNFPCKLLHLWGVTGSGKEPALDDIDRELDSGFYSLLYIVQTMGRLGIMDEIEFDIVTDNMQKVTGDELLCPQKAAVLGAVKVIPLEHPNITCRTIDIILPIPGSRQEERLIGQMAAELQAAPGGMVEIAAFRGAHRWIPITKPYRVEEPGEFSGHLKQEGVYLVTGGLGGMGLTLAEYLAESVKARLILTGRSTFPSREEWDPWLASHDDRDPVSTRIIKIRHMEEMGARIITASADVADLKQMQGILDRAQGEFGPVNGILHTAGIADFEGMILRRTREMTEKILAPKVRGTLVLDRIFRDKPLDFFILFSSIGNVVYHVKFGQVGYNAANEFLDAFARYNTSVNGRFTVSINWNDWQEVGMSVDSIDRKLQGQRDKIDYEVLLRDALLPSDGVEVFRRILGSGLVNVTVSTIDLVRTLKWLDSKWDGRLPGIPSGENKEDAHAPLKSRPEVNTPYTAPTGKTQQLLVRIWQNFFKYDLIGIYDDFFEIGGDSLKATVLLGVIHRETGIKIPINEIFTRPTIEKLSEYIEAKDGAEAGTYFSIEPVEKKEYYVLSSVQKRLYILQQVNAGSIAYNESSATALTGDWDRQKLQEISLQLIKRHESLRTSFHLINDEPVQKIHPFEEVEFEIENYDLPGTPGESSSSSVGSIMKHFLRPFDLSAAPLVRLGLVRTGDRDFVLLIDMHHIITDVESLRVFIEDITMFAEGKEPLPLRFQYKDYAEWQISPRQEELLKKMETYWLKSFEGELPQLKLPLDYPRTGQAGIEGYIKTVMGKEAAAKMGRISTGRDATLFMTFLAVYNIFLSRITGSEDIIVGTVTAGRGHSDLERIIGMFVNTLVMRNFPEAGLTFNRFLGDVRERTLSAFENQDYQFDRLVDRVVKTREPGRNPIFDAAYSFYSIPAAGTAGGTSPRTAISKGTLNIPSKFDLLFTVIDDKNEITFSLGYDTKLFKEETVERFFHYINDICSAVLENPDIEIKDILVSHDLTAAAAGVIGAEEGDFGF